jgi:hypothetical protein
MVSIFYVSDLVSPCKYTSTNEFTFWSYLSRYIFASKTCQHHKFGLPNVWQKNFALLDKSCVVNFGSKPSKPIMLPSKRTNGD